ncbi:uncharacterized protein [Physcomitrium patens]|uniref:Ataxin-10 domain-containing protein n=1 Tax=Physcomitrium patens TaxID=3218 RepID=A0A2K1IQC4_PHYPA|nr:ataxin-10-like [Physcomitrium patens]PNR31476.1 hypothetical protein PHYPA_025597 [Physcomitrium patens]|eukprot:XP_024358731.1 ataxin-10-like [Physcomitrella patens]
MAEVETLRSLRDFVSEAGFSNRAEFESRLQLLADFARSDDGRQALAAAEAVSGLLSLSSLIIPSTSEAFPGSGWSSKTFNLYVKLLRNLCAGNSVNQETFVRIGGLEALAPVVRILDAGSFKDGVDVAGTSPVEASVRNTAIEGLQMVLQLLGNTAGLGELSQEKIWEVFFPLIFEIVARVSSVKVQGPLCMVLFTCCRHNDIRCSELSENKGASIVALLLNSGGVDVSNSSSNEWLEFLITHLCFAKPCFRVLFSELGGTIGESTEIDGLPETAVRQSFVKEQAALLDILNASLSAREQDQHSGDPLSDSQQWISMPSTSASFLIDIVRCAAKCAASTGLSALQLPTHSPVADVLGLSLSMIRILCVLDEKRSKILPVFASSGLIPLMLDLLRPLGSPDGAKASTTSTQGGVETNSSTSTVRRMGSEQSSSNGVDVFPSRDVYIGYRRDIVAVIANASHRSFLIQDAVRENGGLLLVLQQCMPDTNNPFLREWGLWAIRNLLEGNSNNQTELADLEIRSVVPDSRLKEAGMGVEIDPETGRPRLVNITPSTESPAVDEIL